jgi:MFS family permease
MWASSALWSITRWQAVFLCSYLVNQLTHSPLLVQLVGAAFFAPMFFAGALGGVISDRFDRRRTILQQLLVLTPIAGGMSALVLAGVVHVWMVYPFMLLVGLGMVIDMTSRRALIYDLVGEGRITNALALESLAMTGGTMLGSLMGGAIVNFIGIGQAFLAIAVFYAASFLLLCGVPSPPRAHVAAGSASVLADIVAGFRFLRGHRALISLFGVTVLFNVFYFSYSPLVPVFADRLDVNAFWTGVLASASGLGSMAGAFLIAALAPRRRGLIYVGGSALALTALVAFAALTWYPAALVALVVAGIGTSGFGTMQSALVMHAAGPAMRGRALGMLSMAIGSLPFAMALLGVAAQGVSAPVAVGGSAVLGLVLMVVWNALRPEARRLT